MCSNGIEKYVFFFIIIFGSTKELHAFLDVNIIDDGSGDVNDII